MVGLHFSAIISMFDFKINDAVLMIPYIKLRVLYEVSSAIVNVGVDCTVGMMTKVTLCTIGPQGPKVRLCWQVSGSLSGLHIIGNEKEL